MSDSLGLELGAQSRAAAIILDRLPQIDTTLRTLAEQVEAASAGFRGGSSAGLVEALRAWFATAGRLAPLMANYANALVEVDASVGEAEERGTSELSATYVPGGSGLNMGPG